MKKVVLTGATGFIGQALLKELLNHNIQTFIIVRKSSRDKIKFEENQNLKIVECELCDILELDKLILDRDLDAFYHLAWEGVSGENRSNYKVQLKNIEETILAVEAAKKLGCKKFVGAGSIMEFECQQIVSKQESKPGTANIYSTAKLTAHFMSKIKAAELNICHIWPYITNAYGVQDFSKRFFNDTLLKMVNNEPLKFTEATQLYDFVYISDIAAGFYLAGESGKNGCTYCIGSGQPRKLKEFIIEMRDIINPKINLKFGEVPSTGINLEKDKYDISFSKSEINYVPQISFAQGVKLALEAINSNK